MVKTYGEILQLFKATKGIQGDTLPLDDTLKSVVAIILGAEMSIFGAYHKVVNLSIVIVLYIYYNLVQLIDIIQKYLVSTNNELCKQIGEFMNKSEIHQIVIFIIFLFIVTSIVIVLLKFFTKIAIICGCIFLFSFGPLSEFMNKSGIENPLVHLLIGVIFGIIIFVMVQNQVTNILLISLFSVVGACLIFLGVGQLSNLHFKWCYNILRMNEPEKIGNTKSVDNELIYLIIFSSVLFIAQSFFYYYHKKNK